MAGKPSRAAKSVDNLKDAFAGESQANRRYLYFAQRRRHRGLPGRRGPLQDTADGETGHAHGHLDFLKEVGDPATGEPDRQDREEPQGRRSPGETYEYTKMYPGIAKTARDEGFDEIAEWFETLAKAEKSHAGRFTEGARTRSRARTRPTPSSASVSRIGRRSERAGARAPNPRR